MYTKYDSLENGLLWFSNHHDHPHLQNLLCWLGYIVQSQIIFDTNRSGFNIDTPTIATKPSVLQFTGNGMANFVWKAEVRGVKNTH